ncbi:hypothetical protein Slin15195_G080000 [Septoria linicola]|uniref:Uncharacterized protein n=1 Tax=Septoria linicola TaxID=215465 RepID=A0A9Q9AZP3_9PEZI|nr:hypothetical protein Slin15195_G080000 [Septoria linicola]
MADAASWPWLEWVASWDNSLVLDDVCDQLHISARHDFLLLMWRHAHEKHTQALLQSMSHYGTLPTQFLPTIDSFLQKYGFWLWPDSSAGYSNRHHLLSTSRYGTRGYYDVQLETWTAHQPYMSLHGSMRSVWYGAEHGLAFSKIGKILQVYFLAMLKQTPEELSRLTATHGTANQALQAILHHNLNRTFSNAESLQAATRSNQFPTIQEGSRPFLHQQGYFMGQALALQQSYFSPAFVTNPWSQSHGQDQRAVHQQRHASASNKPHSQGGYAAYGTHGHQQGNHQVQYQGQYRAAQVPLLQPPPSAQTFRRRAKKERAATRHELALREMPGGGNEGPRGK